jgi:hypothetical protein
LFGISNLTKGLQNSFRPAGQFDLDGPGLWVLPPKPLKRPAGRCGKVFLFE